MPLVIDVTQQVHLPILISERLHLVTPNFGTEQSPNSAFAVNSYVEQSATAGRQGAFRNRWTGLLSETA